MKARDPVPAEIVSPPRKSAFPPVTVRVLFEKDSVPVYPLETVMDLTELAASKVALLMLVASKVTSSAPVGAVPLPQFAPVVQLWSFPPPPTHPVAKVQLVLLPPLAQFVHAPAEPEAVLLASVTKLPERDVVTVSTQAEPGFKFKRLAAEVPVKVPAPATVIVTPANPAMELDVPLVTEKLPPLVVVIFLLFKSKTPAVCVNPRQERLLVAKRNVSADPCVIKGCDAPPDLGTNNCAPEVPSKAKVPVPGVSVVTFPSNTLPVTCS